MTEVFAQGSKERMMFNDLWEFCRKFWIVQEDKQYWEEMIKAADDFEQKYQSDKLFCAWIADFISQKEQEYHQKRGE